MHLDYAQSWVTSWLLEQVNNTGQCITVMCTQLYKFLNHHDHQVTLLEWISLTFSLHTSLSLNHSWDIFQTTSCVRAGFGRPTLAQPCEGVYRKISLLISSLLFQQCSISLVHLTWMVLEIWGKWPYSCCFMECCFQDLFSIAQSVPVQFLSSFFARCFVSIHMGYPYCSIDNTTAWLKSHFI